GASVTLRDGKQRHGSGDDRALIILGSDLQNIFVADDPAHKPTGRFLLQQLGDFRFKFDKSFDACQRDKNTCSISSKR
ncbi:MAG TPA: hypothetical protein PLU11_01425, partial [Chitinophagaceae bacterium]|nr:hypothetical protein [Chitinophagaceae bacterium]